MTEVHASEGKVLRAVSTRSKSEATLEEIDPLEALQQIAAILELDTFHWSEEERDNSYHLIGFSYGGREVKFEFKRKFKAYI